MGRRRRVQCRRDADPGRGAPSPPPAAVHILVSHGDCVRTLPADAQLLASSPSCTNELFLIGRNCLGIQSHPEFTLEREVRTLLWPRCVEQGQRLQGEEARKAWESFERYSPHEQRVMLDVINTSLKRRYSS